MVFNLSRSEFLDRGPAIVEATNPKDLSVKNPDDYIARLDEILSPTERLKLLFVSTVNITKEPTYEALWIRKFFFCGLAGGFFAGAIFNSQDAHADYIRKHNASVFNNKHVGNRHFWDTLIYRCAGKGFRYGSRACVLTTTVAAIGVASITYRNKLYLPDWLLGYTAVGALSRLWLGPRAMAAGAAIFLGCGMFGFAMIRGTEMATGISVSEMEYMSHKNFIARRQDLLNRNHLARDKHIAEMAQEAMKSGDDTINFPL